MRVHLELEHKEDFHFATFRSGFSEPYRSLVIRLNGRPFSTWYRLRDGDWRIDDEGYMRNVDETLARQFEAMIEKVFNAAIAAIPDGVDIAQMSEAEIKDVLAGQAVKA